MTYLALFTWPVIVLILFRRFSPGIAIIVSILGGYLLLPTRTMIGIPILPDIDKDTVAAIPALLLAMVLGSQKTSYHEVGVAHQALSGWVPRHPVVITLMLAAAGGALVTARGNSDPLFYGQIVLNGMTTYDGLSNVLTFLVSIVPFLLARKFLARPEDHRTLLIVFCIAGLVYSLPALYEVRMSPMVNYKIYGFFPHQWLQHMRAGGWRPIVFLEHGLWLSLFIACTALATAATVRLVSDAQRSRALMALAWIFATLVLSKSLGALLITLVILPLIFMSPRAQLLFAACVSAAVLLYPTLRASGLMPVNQIYNLASSISEERASSLRFRLENEDLLLEKANQRLLFGWGGWGRARVFNELGHDESITDGYWVIKIGEGGWVGYIGVMGLLTIPILILQMRRKAYEVSLATSALCLILTANVIDLIPNATLTPLTWMVAGALAGRLELRAADIKGKQEAQGTPVTKPQYSRFPPNKGRPGLTARKGLASP